MILFLSLQFQFWSHQAERRGEKQQTKQIYWWLSDFGKIFIQICVQLTGSRDFDCILNGALNKLFSSFKKEFFDLTAHSHQTLKDRTTTKKKKNI